MARLEVVTGPMFCGKSEELIRRLHRAIHADKKVLVIKPITDTRTSREIASRRKRKKEDHHFQLCERLEAVPIPKDGDYAFSDLYSQHIPDVIGIDEAQFFNSWIVKAIQNLLVIQRSTDLTIIVSGLDTDYKHRPFGQMPQLMAIANTVSKLSAICFSCKQEASLTYRKPGISEDTIVVGGEGIYEARCFKCHDQIEL